MDVDDRLPVFREHVVEHLVAQDARSVEHDVQSAKGIAGLLDHRETVVEFGDRAVIRCRLAARRFDLVDDLLRRRLVGTFAAAASAWIVDHDLCTVRRHQLGDLGSDTPTRAGANRNPSFEHAHPSTPSVLISSPGLSGGMPVLSIRAGPAYVERSRRRCKK